MKAANITIALMLLMYAVGAWADMPAKTLICHVGNEVGPNGEEYLDDPGCVPVEENGHFCPDAGKIDLIEVANATNHLGNPSHSYGGISDYQPEDIGASGVGNEDTNSDGIDDGCAAPEPCPCWDEVELLAITYDNRDLNSCDMSELPFYLSISGGVPPGVEGGFFAWNYPDLKMCDTLYYGGPMTITGEEAAACIAQIEERCWDTI